MNDKLINMIGVIDMDEKSMFDIAFEQFVM